MKSKVNGKDYGSQVLDGAIEQLTGGLQLEEGRSALNSAFRALHKQAKALEGATYDKKKYADNARSMAHTAKVIDSIGRFLEFAEGNADSRPELYGKNLVNLTDLSDEQLLTLNGWYEEKQRKSENDSENTE